MTPNIEVVLVFNSLWGQIHCENDTYFKENHKHALGRAYDLTGFFSVLEWRLLFGIFVLAVDTTLITLSLNHDGLADRDPSQTLSQ